ncbi:hypothetical protein NST07_20540 [Paenibacillus sp. FSL L8-0340]|uniref:hypothetical protein n=1 Tax=Paenibacillus sp. FSL L8-0340 TaxID=2954685 RepID=UPI00315816B6
MLTPEDFEDIEIVIKRKFQESVPLKNSDDDERKFAEALLNVAARVSVLALNEYHNKLNEKKP